MNARDLLAEFAHRAKIAGLAFNPAGRARIQVDTDLIMELEQEPAANQLHAYVVLGQPPADKREQFFAGLLAKNLFCKETRGATLALDPPSSELLLCRVLDLAVTDYAAFERALEDLANTAAAIRAEIESAPKSAPKPATDPDESFARQQLETGAWLRA